ncbi:MAG: replication-associated recombination protein A [Clostridia bacterium]|nr:replication-associated recombination protein A [Clostridia bacterium]
MSRTPLADRVRPLKIDDVAGQKHLLGEGRLLRKIIQTGETPNMIFYGPSGTGKTTVANIIASNTGKKLYKMNATNASVSDIKNIIAELDSFMTMNGVLLYLDEIQHFNKKQQQSLLEFMENGTITVIASTTENPYFYIYNAVLSRSSVFEFYPLKPEDVEEALWRAVKIEKETDYRGYTLNIDSDAIRHISHVSGGDARKAINALELMLLSAVPDSSSNIHITLETACQATQRKALRYDRDGDSHYDILSAFQKSIRGSDPDAAVHYLARLISAGDLQSICRRLLVTAAEDVGLAYPLAMSITKACVDSALQLGLPEARIPLAEAVILLATTPKSNSAICAIDAAMSDIENMDTGDVPKHLKDAHYVGAKELRNGTDYKYPHIYENHYVIQQYMPDNIKDKKYYEYGNNKNENMAREYWKKIKNGE